MEVAPSPPLRSPPPPPPYTATSTSPKNVNHGIRLIPNNSSPTTSNVDTTSPPRPTREPPALPPLSDPTKQQEALPAASSSLHSQAQTSPTRLFHGEAAFSLPKPQNAQRPESPRIILPEISQGQQSRNVSYGSTYTGKSDFSEDGRIKQAEERPATLSSQLPYHHRSISEAGISAQALNESNSSLTPGLRAGPRNPNTLSAVSHDRPQSSYPSLENGSRGRTGSPSLSPNSQLRSPSSISPARKSPDARTLSYIDLLNVPYPQPAPSPLKFDNAYLQTSVGNNASLLGTQKTLEMYRANVKKTNDSSIQYSFALFMIETAQEIMRKPPHSPGSESSMNPAELIQEARQILQRLADRSYPFAQYYLADGYASGFFNKGKEDNDRAFALFIAASKHGHAEAGYRAALCYEFGWGTRRDPMKAVQFYRQSASKNHPGAMTRLARACLTGDLGMGVQYREGIKWLKRAAESADKQYNSAPYELGLLHEKGYGDDVFKDEQYAAQLFTQAADLGNADAAFKLGEAYEHQYLQCPHDPALSIHFYSIAASQGHAMAMMALCAWYMLGVEPFLEKDEKEAFEWAKRAAESGMLKKPKTSINRSINLD
jgi:TPR repeat protein